MAETTGISWTRSTFNPWIGCTEIGPGCDECYARELDKRHRWGGDTHWGNDKPRYRTKDASWNAPLRWNELAAVERAMGEVAETKGKDQAKHWHTPGFWPVFCASLADVFDNQVSDDWREDLWAVIEGTPNLSWLLVTKRIGNVPRMVPERWIREKFPDHVRLLISVVNQDEADRDVPKLVELPCKNGISYEPAIAPVNWWEIPVPGTHGDMIDLAQIQWMIIGGESRQGQRPARPFDLDWAFSTIDQCSLAGTPVFVKQLGSHQVRNGSHFAPASGTHRAGADPKEWPKWLRIQEFPK